MSRRKLRQNCKKVVGISVMVSVTGVIISLGNSNNKLSVSPVVF